MGKIYFPHYTLLYTPLLQLNTFTKPTGLSIKPSPLRVIYFVVTTLWLSWASGQKTIVSLTFLLPRECDVLRFHTCLEKNESSHLAANALWREARLRKKMMMLEREPPTVRGPVLDDLQKWNQQSRLCLYSLCYKNIHLSCCQREKNCHSTSHLLKFSAASGNWNKTTAYCQNEHHRECWKTTQDLE